MCAPVSLARVPRVILRHEDQSARALATQRMAGRRFSWGAMIVINTKGLLLAGVFGGALAVAHWTGVLESAIQLAHSETVPATSEQIAADKLSSKVREWRGKLDSRGFNSETVGDAFSRKSWAPPKPALPVAASNEPLVQPFAYNYIGRLWSGGSSAILLLTKAANLYWLREGDVIDGVFRIEAINEDHLELVHIATKTRLTRSYDDLVVPSPAAHAGMTPGNPMTMAQATSPAASPEGRGAPDASHHRHSDQIGTGGSSSVPSPTAAGRPAAGSVSTPAAPSNAGSPMQMLPPGRPMEMTMPGINTVPPQGLNPIVPANVVPPQGAGK